MIFKNLIINKIKLQNKIVVSPMCQYSGDKGSPTEWHYSHLSNLIKSGAGMVMIESTAVNKIGKISNLDLCLENEKQEKKFKDLKIFLNKINNIPIGIQISHSGRKGSTHVPWFKKNTPLKNNSWKTISASSIRRSKGWPLPKKMTKNDIKKLINDFSQCAIRSNRVGFECLEVHMAHGYLLHQFLSPISNKRIDEYGGSLINRCSVPLEIAKKIRKVWPKNKILGARITGTDHLPGGINLKDSVYLVKQLEKIGFDYVCVSSGGILPITNMKSKRAFRKNLSHYIKKNSSILVRTSGQIDSYDLANNIIKNNLVDFVAIGRKFINDPFWLIKQAKLKKIKNYIPKQYLRCI